MPSEKIENIDVLFIIDIYCELPEPHVFCKVIFAKMTKIIKYRRLFPLKNVFLKGSQRKCWGFIHPSLFSKSS